MHVGLSLSLLLISALIMLQLSIRVVTKKTKNLILNGKTSLQCMTLNAIIIQ